MHKRPVWKICSQNGWKDETFMIYAFQISQLYNKNGLGDKNGARMFLSLEGIYAQELILSVETFKRVTEHDTQTFVVQLVLVC